MIPFIQFLVFSSPIIRNSMSVFKVSKNSLLHRSYGRLAKRGGARYEKRNGYAALSLLDSELSAPEKSMKQSQNHTFKNSSMACVALTFSNLSGSFLIKSKVGRRRRISCTRDIAGPLILGSRIGRRLNASLPTL
jgi:hypothetical protein